MGTHKRKSSVKTAKHIHRFSGFSLRYFLEQFKTWWSTRFWHKIVVVVMVAVLLFVSGMYTVAQWYIYSQKGKPVHMGATFVPAYAERLGVDPKQTLYAIFHELGVKDIRLVSYWDRIEANSGTYDFTELDWQFKMAEEADAKVSLAIGLRQPRWPECHMPTWAKQQPKDFWYPRLKSFITAVVERYRDNPSLDSYQLENEFFLTVFGKCKDFDRDRLVEEAALVKKLDPDHTLIISRSNNGVGLPIGKPTPDLFGVSVYKRVWDKTLTKRYFEYPFPAWFYASLAGGGKIVSGKDLIIHELQAEPWAPDGFDIVDAPVEELYKSMNAERLRDRFEYAKATGMKRMDLWGVEWWYQMKIKRGEPSIWNAAVEEYTKTAQQNADL